MNLRKSAVFCENLRCGLSVFVSRCLLSSPILQLIPPATRDTSPQLGWPKPTNSSKGGPVEDSCAAAAAGVHQTSSAWSVGFMKFGKELADHQDLLCIALHSSVNQ